MFLACSVNPYNFSTSLSSFSVFNRLNYSIWNFKANKLIALVWTTLKRLKFSIIQIKNQNSVFSYYERNTVQSTLDISNCQGTNKFVRDIESSTYRVFEISRFDCTSKMYILTMNHTFITITEISLVFTFIFNNNTQL